LVRRSPGLLHCGVDRWVEVALEEYKTLRQESLGAIEQIQTTLQIGLVAIGVITGFGVEAAAGSIKTDTDVAVRVGLVFVPPLLAGLIIVMCLEELRRAVDAGIHVARLEQQVASRPGTEQPPPLTWETAIQRKHSGKHGYAGHWWRTAALFGAACPAVVLGFVGLRDGDHDVWLWRSGAAAVLLVVATIGFQCWRHHQMRKAAVGAVESIRHPRPPPSSDY
jgi:hypothetical protein